MIFEKTKIAGAFLLKLERKKDSRGFFARSFCQKEFAAQGLHDQFVQCNISYNETAGTLRGLHLQIPPHEEIKVVYCSKGAIFDVIVDLRKDSPSYQQWAGFELTAENRDMLYIPKGCAHGFQTLLNDTELFYLMGQYYYSTSARGIKWNDPAIGIAWPNPRPIISEKDQMLPLLSEYEQ